MNTYTYTEKYLDKLHSGLEKIPTTAISHTVALLAEARAAHNRVYLIGNGGSATLASHMATDLQLAGVMAQALTDVATLTTYANDVSYVDCFRIPVARLGGVGDVLIGISGSGNSPNILAAMELARGIGMSTIGVSGMSGGKLLAMPLTIHLHADTPDMPQAQDIQQTILHIVSYALMSAGTE